MTSPVSIGDAIMLSQLAYTIGRAFTSGRKSAPAEFHEIQNHLFVLGSALGLLANDQSEKQKSAEGTIPQAAKVRNVATEQDAILEQMISNCKETLTHLEMLIEKYMEIDPNAVTSVQTAFKSWRQDVKKNWKKIKWTTEGGDLDKLRNNLAVHVSGLTLAMSAMHSTQTRNVENKVNKVHNMLNEIHEWYIKNLKTDKTSPRLATSSGGTMSIPDIDPVLTFEVYVEVPAGNDISLICLRASFDPGWLKYKDTGKTSRLFLCHCELSHKLDQASAVSQNTDHTADLQFSLLPATLITKLIGPQNLWQLHVLSPESNGWVSLIIGGVAPSNLGEFNQCISQLAAHQIKQLHANASNSMLIQLLSDGSQETARILESKSNVREINGEITLTSFITSGYRFNLDSIDTVQLLQYRIIAALKEKSPRGHSNAKSCPESYAELVLRPLRRASNAFSEQKVAQYIVNIRRDTRISRPKSNLVCLSGVQCSAEQEDDEVEYIPNLDIEIVLTSTSVAQKFTASIEAMQRELLLSYCRFPQMEEQVIFQRPAGDLMARDFYLPDATLTVTFDTALNEHRMILLSCCTSMCVSMKLPASFFSEPKINTDYPAYFVKIGWNTTRIIEQDISFRLLLPADQETLHDFSKLLQDIAQKVHNQ